MESPTVWNQSLYSIVQKLEPRRVGLDPYSFQHLLTSGQVKFEGTGPANRNYFIVRPEPWVLDGLEGYIALRLDKSMTAQDAAFHWRNLSITMRRLEPLISTYADKRLTRLPEGQRWAPVAAFVQVLLARAWLRGGTVPTEQPHLQLKTILSDEREAESDPAARCTPWQEFLNRTNPWHDDWRRALREMLATPQGEARGFGLADVSLAAGAILRFRESLKFDPIPAQNIETGVDEFDTIRSVVDTTGPTLFAINRIERDQIRGRADTLRRNLRQRSIRAHFQRIDNDIDIVAKHLPGAAPDRVRDWKQSYARVTARLQLSTDAVEELLFTLTEDGDGPPARNGPLVEWLVRAPARDLSEFRDLSEKGEQVVARLLDHVRDCVDEGRGSASLEAIRIVGRKLRDAIRSDLVEPTREPV